MTELNPLTNKDMLIHYTKPTQNGVRRSICNPFKFSASEWIKTIDKEVVNCGDCLKWLKEWRN